MKLPPFIEGLPEADLPYPASEVKTGVLQSAHGQLVFFQIHKDVEIPPHRHGAQWGTVLEGEVEVTIDGVPRRYRVGESYYIPPGVEHSARAPAGSKVIDFFEEADRYKLKLR